MRVRALLLPLVAAAAFLAGCTSATGTVAPTPSPTPTDNGIAALPVDQILSKANDAVKAASSFHVKGNLSGQGVTYSIDVVYAGANAKGTVTVSGVPIEVIRIGADTYAKAPDAFWAQVVPANLQAQALALLSGKYAKVPASIAALLPSADDLLKPTGTPTKGDASTVNGTPVIALVDTDGSKIFIATMGQPYPVQIQNSGSGAGNIDFSEFGAGATVEAPAASEVVDLTPFMSGS